MNATAISRLRMLEIRSKYKRFVGKHQTLFKNRDFMYPGDLQRLSGVKISNTRRWVYREYYFCFSMTFLFDIKNEILLVNILREEQYL